MQRDPKQDDRGRPARTPNTDMQAEDAGTPDSGAGQPDERGQAAEPATKQTSKTDHESGSGR